MNDKSVKSVKKIHQYHINKQINNIKICYNNYLK